MKRMTNRCELGSYFKTSSLKLLISLFVFCFLPVALPAQQGNQASMFLNKLEYLEYQGVNVMLAHDFYPEGHQGGVGIIQNGQRVATNGDIRLEPTPGQWAPVPVQKDRALDRAAGEIVTTLAYPDPDKDRKGFNPIEYPDLAFSYKVRV